MKKTLILAGILFFSTSIFWAQDASSSFDSVNLSDEQYASFMANKNGHAEIKNSLITSTSTINWTKNTFSSDISLDVIKSGIPMPSGKVTSVNKIQMELPVLVKDPLLSVCVDDTNTLNNLILDGTLTLEQFTHIIDESQQRAPVFYEGGKKLLTNHTIDLKEIGALLIKHRTPYTQQIPIQRLASRKYTGIIIDARGILPVQGEFISSKAEPCIFPKIWNENMELVYEKNMVEPKIAKEKGIVLYSSSPLIESYENRVGKDPLWISAKKIFGVNRVDPVISENDWLKITSVKENLELLKQGKIVILLDEKTLVHKVSAPDRNKQYFMAYREMQKYFYENKIPDTILKEDPSGISITMQNLNFIADSAELLPEEKPRIQEIAKSLIKLTSSGEFNILVEGHTADVNKPNGQMQLSIERAKAIIELLVEYGVNKDLFTYRGYGGTRPIANNSSPEGRAQNRRVEITAMPKASYIMATE